MSSASVPNPGDGQALPDLAPSRPEIVRPSPAKNRPRGLWWGALCLALIAGAGIYLNQQRKNPETGGGGPGATVARTAVVSFGELRRTVRLGGTIQAERFSAIVAPRLRGNRGSQSGNRVSSRNTTSNASNVSSASSAVSASTNAIVLHQYQRQHLSPSSDTSGSTATTATASSLGATRGTTNRFSDRTAAGGSAAAAAAATSSTLGATGLGSTAGNIPPSSSSGGGGSPDTGGDFNLVLSNLPNPGGRVKTGDVVAEFDRVNMLNRVDDYKDSVVQAEASIRNKQATLAVTDEAHKQSVRVAKSDMEKAKLDLQTLEVVSDIDAEKLKLAAEETEAHYNQLLKEVPLLKKSQDADVRGDELTRDVSKIELQKSISNADRMIMK